MNSPNPTPRAHEFELLRDEQRPRGWYLSWACKRRCGAHGNSTLPDREQSLRLYEIVAQAHGRTADASPQPVEETPRVPVQD